MQLTAGAMAAVERAAIARQKGERAATGLSAVNLPATPQLGNIGPPPSSSTKALALSHGATQLRLNVAGLDACAAMENSKNEFLTEHCAGGSAITEH